MTKTSKSTITDNMRTIGLDWDNTISKYNTIIESVESTCYATNSCTNLDQNKNQKPNCIKQNNQDRDRNSNNKLLQWQESNEESP